MRKRLILCFLIVISLGIFAVDIDGNYSNFLYYGTGTKSGNEIILTNSGAANVGGFWSRHLFDLSQDFEANFEIYMGASDAGADGVAFFFKPEEYKTRYFADSGGQLGYGGSDAGGVIFQKTFGLKFDTYKNGAEPAADHLAFIKEGDVTGVQQKSLPNIEDGQWHNVSISWDASANSFSYNFDGTTDTYAGNITTFLGATTGYFGFTGATGSQSNAQKIRNVEVTATIPDSEYKLKVEQSITSGATYSIGRTIEYEVIIRNLGTETISNLNLSSNTGVTYSNWTQGSSSLAPGASITVNGEQTATQQDVLNGSIVDTVTATGTLPGGEQLNDASEARAVVSLVEFYVAKSVSNVTKGANGGLELEYTFEFVNVGQETLTNLVVTDPKIPGITMDKTTIPSGERAVGTADYTVTQADINAGQIINTATFSIRDPQNQTLTKDGTNTYDLPMLEDFIGSKAVLRGSNFTYVGEIIEYEFLIENIGNRSLSNLTVVDPGISGSVTLNKTTLLPGETASGTGIHTVTQADLDAGNVASTAKFTGTALGGNLVEKEDTITVAGTLIDNFEGRKTVLRGNNFTAVGDEIGYSFEIENTGNRTLNNLTVTDPGVSGVIILDETSIIPGQTARGTGIYTVTQADINAEEVISTATFTGTSPAGTSIQKQDSTRVKAALVEDFEAKKLIVSGNNFVSVGDEIEYSFEINNIGNTTLNNLMVTDPKIPGGITMSPAIILPGEKATGTGTYRVIQADITAGEVTNTAIFRATTAQGSTVRKQASVSSSGVNFGVISTQVTSSPKEVSYGRTIRYSVEVTNTGTSDIKNLTVYDNISDIENKKNEKIFTNITTVSVRDSSGDVAYSDGITNSSSNLVISNLAAGKTVTILLDAEIKDASHITLTGGEQIKNQVLVTGKDPVDDGPLYPTVPYSSLDTGQISVTEDGDKIIEPNEKATYTITIENTGGLRVENISITDKISEIVNLNGDFVFNRASTSDIKVIDGIGVSVPFTYDSSIEEIIVSEIKANNKVTVVINAISKNIKFTEGEIITNKAIVNGTETLSTLNAATGIVTDLGLKKGVITTGDDNIAELDDSITYTIEVINKNAHIALKDLVMEDSLQTVVNAKGELALRNINITKIYNKDTLAERNDLKPNSYTGSLSIPVILPNETLVIEIQANLNRDAVFVNNEVIDNIAKIDLLRNQNSGASAGSASGLQDGAPIIVMVPELYIEKTAQKSKISMGEEVIYTIKVSNTSDTVAKDVKIEDAVSQIEGNTIKGLKESVFTNWKWETESTNFKNKLPGDSKDLKIENVTLASKESVTFILTAKTNPNIIDVSFENTASVTEGLTAKVKKSTFKINSANAEIIVTKSANKREARRGEFITYSVRIENPNSVPVKNIKIFDTPPVGFEYMKKSSRFFRTNEKSQEIKPVSDKPLIYEELNNAGIDINAKEVFEITYMFKVGIGVRNGEAENKVVVKSSLNEVISNTGKVTVKIVDDPLFDATTIIGKVFNDRDMDGFQDTANAEDLLISLEGYEFAVTRLIDGISTTERTKNNTVIESLGEGDEVILIFKPVGDLWETNVTTKSGTNITLTDSNKIFTDHSKKKKRGMTGEDIYLSQKVLEVKGEDYVAVTIVNDGREEKGVPGARLMTIDGLIIETDRYGRFHVPPVKKDRGNSYLIKLDTNSLPMGSTVTTENPKVKRLTRSMTKFNYGVNFPEQRSRLKEKEMVVNIGEVFFIKNKAEFSPGQEINLEILAEKLKKHKKSSIIIQIDTNSDGLKSLGLIRSNIIKRKLKELLGETASDIEIIIERGDKND